MASKKPKIVIDSGALTSRLTGEPPQYQQGIANLWHAVDKRRADLYGSTLLVVEVLGGGFKELPDPAKDAAVLRILDNPEVLTLIQTTRQVAIIARELRVEYNLPVADSVHLASAIFVGADYFMTTDKDDFRIGTEVRGVKIEFPDFPNMPDVLDP